MFKVISEYLPFIPEYENVHDAITTADHIAHESHGTAYVVFPTGERQKYYYVEGLVMAHWDKL